jgi:putative selenium metabolism protein SsnA
VKRPVATLIGPATVITCDAGNRVLLNGGLVLEGTRITAVDDFAALRSQYPAATHYDAGGRTLMPGLINAHAHFYGLFARGMALKDPPPASFRQVLERLWWRLDKALDLRGVHLSALLAGVAALRAGCTTIIDHHASPGAIDGSLDQIGSALDQIGLRGCLCYEVSDRDGAEVAQAAIAENARFARQVVGSRGRLAAKFGLHASFTLSTETLRTCKRVEAELGTGFHIHCAEGLEDGLDAWEQHGQGVVQRLLHRGILGPESIVAHCVHIDAAQMELLAASHTFVTHQPHSNMGNGVGWARVAAMREQGIPVALGTDGYTWDLLESMRTGAVLHSHSTGKPGTGVGEMAQVLLQGNAALASRIFGRKVGVLEAGAVADVILLDYYPPTPIDAANLPWHLQFGITAPQVNTVWVDGRLLMVDRAIGHMDEEQVAHVARSVAAATWERF